MVFWFTLQSFENYEFELLCFFDCQTKLIYVRQKDLATFFKFKSKYYAEGKLSISKNLHAILSPDLVKHFHRKLLITNLVEIKEIVKALRSKRKMKFFEDKIEYLENIFIYQTVSVDLLNSVIIFQTPFPVIAILKTPGKYSLLNALEIYNEKKVLFESSVENIKLDFRQHSEVEKDESISQSLKKKMKFESSVEDIKPMTHQTSNVDKSKSILRGLLNKNEAGTSKSHTHSFQNQHQQSVETDSSDMDDSDMEEPYTNELQENSIQIGQAMSINPETKDIDERSAAVEIGTESSHMSGNIMFRSIRGWKITVTNGTTIIEAV